MPKPRSRKPLREFDIIAKYMQPLTRNHPGALKLQDDIAILAKDTRTDYVITLDTIAESTHFLKSATPQQIASKLLRSNLSDIASCGAAPKFYFLTGNMAGDMNGAWLKKFTDELQRIQKQYGLILLGGDTVRADAPKFFSVTMIGEVAKNKALLRNGAKPGDDIYISGPIGLAWAGLNILQQKLKIPKTKHREFIKKHYEPEPRIKLGQALIGIANSCTDISDGLLKDLSNILKTSNVSAILDARSIPMALSEKKYLLSQLSAGDDYELVFTVSPKHAQHLKKLGVIHIGKVVKNDKAPKITILDKNNKEIKFQRLGYEH